MLEKVLGPGQAIVRVSAEINFDTTSSTAEKYDPDGQVIRTQTKNDESTIATTSSSTSAVGISANTSTDTNSVRSGSSPINNSDNHKTTSTVEYEINKTVSSLTQAAGGIKRLSAAVTVAAQYDGTGTDRKVVNRSPEELDKLKQIVIGAIGIQTGADNIRNDTLTLEELPFNDEFATTMTQQLDQQQQRQFWWDTARNFVYPALGLVALVVLLRIFKRTPVQEIPLGVPVGKLMGQQNGNGNGNGHSHWHPEPQPGVVTVDVLNRLIKENPSNMSQAIRDWMNRGSTPER